MRSTFRPWDKKAIDNGKDKPQSVKLYDLTKGGTDIIDQFNEYCNTWEKSSWWVTMVLFHKLDTFTVNVKTISNFSSYVFWWNMAKTLAFSHVSRRTLYGFISMVQLTMKMFLGTALEVLEVVSNIKNRYKYTGKRKRCKLNGDNCWSKSEKDNIPISK